MNLADYATLYLAEVGASPRYCNLVRGVVRRLPVNIRDLTPAVINEFLSQELLRYQSSTVRTHRAVLHAIFNHAVAAGLVDRSIGGSIRRVKRRQTIPVAWSREQMLSLYAACGKLGGRFRRAAERSQVMQAAVLFGYSSALRLSDLLAVRHDALRGNVLTLVAQKSGRVHTVVMTAESLSAVEQMPRIGQLVFGDLVSVATFLRWFKRGVKLAGLEGTPRYLRRSSATYACLAGIDPTGHLGHANPQLARQHYLDPSLLAEGRPAVPPLLPPSFAPETVSAPRTGSLYIADTCPAAPYSSSAGLPPAP